MLEFSIIHVSLKKNNKTEPGDLAGSGIGGPILGPPGINGRPPAPADRLLPGRPSGEVVAGRRPSGDGVSRYET